MRVLHIGKYFPPFAGGMEYFLADLMRAQQGQGIQVAALVHAHQQPSPIPPVYRAPCYGRLLYAPISPQFPFWLRRVIQDFRPDLLHFHVPNTSAFWAMLVPAARRIPWIIHWHADVVTSQIDRRLALVYRAYRPFEQRLLAASRVVITTSPAYLEASEALRPWRPKCQVIPLGLDPARILEPEQEDFARAEQLWGRCDFRVLVVGRLTYYKGHEVLIRAAAQLPEVRLVIVGEGEYRGRLEALIKALGMEARVLLTGFQAEPALNALFAGCDVLCLPSLERTEAFGMVLLEAMHFGKPVVASDIPGSGVGWVVRQGGHGVLVEPGDCDALAQALREIARTSQERNDLGHKGYQALHSTFHISRVAEQTRHLYRELCPSQS